MRKKFFLSISFFVLPTTVISTNINNEIQNKNEHIEHIWKNEGILTQNVKIITCKLFNNEKSDIQMIFVPETKSYYFYDIVSKTYVLWGFNSNLELLSNDIYVENLQNFYFKIENNIYKHLFTNEILNISELDSENKILKFQLQKIRTIYKNGKVIDDLFYENYFKSSNKNLPTKTVEYKNKKYKNYYVDGYQYLQNMIHPWNKNGTCRYTALTILMWWWHKKTNNNFIPEQFLDSNGNLYVGINNINGKKNLQDELLSYKIDNWIDAQETSNAIDKFAKKYNKNIKSSWILFNFGIMDELKNGRPVLACGDFPKFYDLDSKWEHNSKKSFHCVVIYGWNKDYYIANWGWGTDSQHAFMLKTTFGSNMKLKVF
ncbi:C39 family peptidase [Mycoplasmopsis gallinarum]